jgi:beta-galactosidase/beta-glucuronidase
MSIRKPVQTYRLKMSKEEGKTGIKCYALKISYIDKIILKYIEDDDEYFYFEAEIEGVFKDRSSGVIIEKHYFLSNYLLHKTKEIKHYRLMSDKLYKITYNKIELHD